MICLCMSASICMAIRQISLRATVVWLKGLNQTKDAQLEGVIREARKRRGSWHQGGVRVRTASVPVAERLSRAG